MRQSMSHSHDLSILDSPEPFDVCIIGSGFVGTILGTRLAEAGVRTLVLESGGSLARWLVDGRLKALAAYEVTGDANYPAVRTKARAVGGNSNFWTGRCERYHPTDFAQHPYTPRDNPWPITYEDLEPYYARAEQTLRVRGGPLSDYAPPRRSNLPLPPQADISSLKAMMADIDVTVDESPTAAPRHAIRFFRVGKELMPAFLSSPNGVLVTGVTVTKLLADGERRIVGAEARTLDGPTKVARAKVFVVACGGIETPRLLLLSRSEQFPNGIGNAYDRVGRGFNEHPGVNFYAKIRHNRHTMTPRHRIGRSHQFYDTLRPEGLGSVLPVFIQSWIFPNHLALPKLQDIPKSVAALFARVARPTLYIGATIEMEPCDDNRVSLAANAKDRFGNPLAHLHLSFTERDRATLERTRELIRELFARVSADGIREGEVTWSRHHIGTCRMGDDPKTSVADPNLRVHDCPNLYLCGSETFVTGAAVPPVMTIVALTLRLGDHLLNRLREG